MSVVKVQVKVVLCPEALLAKPAGESSSRRPGLVRLKDIEHVPVFLKLAPLRQRIRILLQLSLKFLRAMDMKRSSTTTSHHSIMNQIQP